MSSHSSHEIAGRFGLQMPSDLATWLDGGLWARQAGGEFRFGQSPELLSNPEAGTIWAGLMLPDTLPLIGNDRGDWLCLRVDWSGRVAEYIAWYHAGGDWVPFGRTLPEALTTDALLQQAQWQTSSIGTIADAVPPLTADTTAVVRQLAGEGRLADARLADARLADALEAAATPAAARAQLSAWGERSAGAPGGVIRGLVVECLRSTLGELLDADWARAQEIAWEPDAVSALFDQDLMTDAIRETVAEMPPPASAWKHQDWATAERLLARLLVERQDLLWVADLAGWAAERRGDLATAAARYHAGLQASAFTDASLAFRTHWFPDGQGKFSAARLRQCQDQLPPEIRHDPYLQLFAGETPESLRTAVQQYWLDKAAHAAEHGDHRAAFGHYYRAGWDLGAARFEDYLRILDGLLNAAESGGALAIAAVVRLHRAQFAE